MLNKDCYNKAYLNIINERCLINPELNRRIALFFGGVYDEQTNTIDCKQNRIRFVNWIFNAEGSFDFKLKNVDNGSWPFMFKRCYKLKYLPEDFTIPEGVTECDHMFYGCTSLKRLPENFNLPSTIKHCDWMFLGCDDLLDVPRNFNIPTGCITCDGMFSGCQSIEVLPDQFTIPNTVLSSTDFFFNCYSLIELPYSFTIPADCDTYDMFTGCENLTEQQKDVSQYRMLEV